MTTSEKPIGSKVLDVIRERHSVREYAEFSEVPREHLELLAEAALLAPSASNFQPWTFVFVTDKSLVREVGRCATQKFVSSASAIVVGVVDRNISPHWNKFDLAIAMEHIVLVATELGHGTCHVGSFRGGEVRAALGIPESHEVVELLSLGPPKSGNLGGTRFRKPLEETAFLNRWGKPL
ncbi:MAG: nitroreductase family protein [Promethearchaeota archaeon]